MIGAWVKLYQGVSLGARSASRRTRRAASSRAASATPISATTSSIYANTTVLGADTHVGAGSTIGGNVFLTQSVPPDSLVIYEETQLRILPKKGTARPRPRMLSETFVRTTSECLDFRGRAVLTWASCIPRNVAPSVLFLFLCGLLVLSAGTELQESVRQLRHGFTHMDNAARSSGRPAPTDNRRARDGRGSDDRPRRAMSPRFTSTRSSGKESLDAYVAEIHPPGLGRASRPRSPSPSITYTVEKGFFRTEDPLDHAALRGALREKCAPGPNHLCFRPTACADVFCEATAILADRHAREPRRHRRRRAETVVGDFHTLPAFVDRGDALRAAGLPPTRRRGRGYR